jgi:predicted transcriptional regulator
MQNYDRTQSNHEEMSNALEARVYDLDIYREMMDRLKKDILIMKKRNFDKDIALRKDNVKVRTLRQDDFNKTKLSYKCRDMLESIERTVVNKQYERSTKINSFYDSLNRRHNNIVRREERDREIEDVMMKAMSEKLTEEKEWINICMVNLFFKRFLKNKMEALIKQHEEIESAYHKIKSNTDIKDCKDLIWRFLNRERNYGALLERISEKENKL